MDVITLGADTYQLNVRMCPDTDFYSTIRNPEGPWAAGTEIELRLQSFTITATIAGDLATFDEDAEYVNSILATSERRVKLFYINDTSGDQDICWAVGRIRVCGEE